VPLQNGQGRGIAQHYCFGGFSAHVAEVSVNQDKTIKVHRVVCVIESGPIVNPDIIKAQAEGGVIMGLSTFLHEKIEFSKGGVKSSNFSDYPILRMSETPEIEVHIIESDDPIGGVGEPVLPPLAPAVANAVFNATGIRLRELPFKLS